MVAVFQVVLAIVVHKYTVYSCARCIGFNRESQSHQSEATSLFCLVKDSSS